MFAAAFVLVVLSASTVTAAGNDSIALKFAPHYWFEETEGHYPASLDWLLQNSNLQLTDTDGETKTVKSAPLTLADIKGKNESYTVEFLDTADVKTPPDYSNMDTRLRLYYNVQAGNGFLRINYWSIYAYNGPRPIFCWLSTGLGRHDGDIERVSVYIDNAASKILAVDYAQHSSHQCMTSGYHTDDPLGNHPHVAVGRDTHASYPDTGQTLECTKWHTYWAPIPQALPTEALTFDGMFAATEGFASRRATFTSAEVDGGVCA